MSLQSTGVGAALLTEPACAKTAQEIAGEHWAQREKPPWEQLPVGTPEPLRKRLILRGTGALAKGRELTAPALPSSQQHRTPTSQTGSRAWICCRGNLRPRAVHSQQLTEETSRKGKCDESYGARCYPGLGRVAGRAGTQRTHEIKAECV